MDLSEVQKYIKDVCTITILSSHGKVKFTKLFSCIITLPSYCTAPKSGSKPAFTDIRFAFVSDRTVIFL